MYKVYVEPRDDSWGFFCIMIETRFIEVSEDVEEFWDYMPGNSDSVKNPEIFKIRKYSSY